MYKGIRNIDYLMGIMKQFKLNQTSLREFSFNSTIKTCLEKYKSLV